MPLKQRLLGRRPVKQKDRPTCLLLTRQGMPVLHDYAKVIAKGAPKGAYILSPCPKEEDLKAVIIATGSEVHLALEAQKKIDETSYRRSSCFHAQLGSF